GYLWAMGLSLAVSAHVILHHQFFFPAMRLGFQMRSGLIALLYRKALSLPASAATSTGEVVNLVSNDAQCFETASVMAHFIWAGPIEIILVMAVLYWRIGWAAFVGIGVLVWLFPLHSVFARRYSHLRQKTSSYRDDRIRTVGDLLAGVELIKLSAWEDPLEKRVNEQRDKELGSLLSAAWIKATSESIRFCITGIVSLVTFSVYYASGNPLTPDKVFTCMALFNVIRNTIGIFFPQAVEKLAECTVSVRRIVAFLQLPEVDDLRMEEAGTAADKEDSPPSDKVAVSFKQASFTWATPPHPLVLDGITLDIMKDELLVVVGPVGSGKSSLCMTVLRELLPISGALSFHIQPREPAGQLRIAYLSQNPWILSGTVRENILFGNAYDDAWYQQVVHGCALEKDFALLAEGDSTFIGERGALLSGGQRARIALARAVYMRADMYVFDDPLSAVDPQVARHLFDHALTKLLAGRPRLLITHQLQFTRHCDRVLVLEDGRVAAIGTPAELLGVDASSDHAKSSFLHELRDYARQADQAASDAPSPDDDDDEKAKHDGDDGVLVDRPKQQHAEDQAEGNTPIAVYWRFFRFGASPLTITLAALALSGAQAVMVSADWSLARWTNTPVALQTGWHHAYPYIGLVMGTCFLAIFRSTISFWILLNASRWMFRSMLHTVLSAPMQFFHTNPHGRILNRFSKDQSNVDELLPITLFDAVQCLFLILGALVVVCIQRFWNEFSSAQNANARAFFAFLGCARWVGFRLDVGSGFLLILTAFLSVLMRSSQQASLVGLSLIYVLQTVDCLQWAVRQTIEVEMQFISVERIISYTQIAPEPPRHTERRPPDNWPEQGSIEFKDMSLTYPEASEPVLKHITLSIEGGEKIGVVGRTGAGKSSLLTALFRLCESAPAGCIVIDGIPISELGVHDLRSRLSIIPQTPMMFKGTLRFNLDPFDQYSDADLWHALEAVDLKRRIESLPYKLDSPVTEDGKNYSAGERQLISLCR
ncbi:P-loop containing nucleoside triphosphate hydrolase protein, partial [Syncephalis pseudoplumigaleata]